VPRGQVPPGDFALLLTNDDPRTLTETHRKPWLRRKLAAELVDYDLAADPPRMTLASEYGFARAEKKGLIDFGRLCVLDKAEADFNTRRVVATLRALGRRPRRGGARALPAARRASRHDWLLAPFDAPRPGKKPWHPAGAAFGRHGPQRGAGAGRGAAVFGREDVRRLGAAGDGEDVPAGVDADRDRGGGEARGAAPAASW
jgi:hypothetical protein